MSISLLPLYVGVTRDGLPSQAIPQPLISSDPCICRYCAMSVPQTQSAVEPVFYHWVQRNKHIQACVFCACALNINTIGSERGRVVMLPDLSQEDISRMAHVIMAAYASEGELAALSQKGGSPELADLIGYATELRHDLAGVGVMQLGEFDSEPSNALTSLSDALLRAENYVTAINNSAPYMRYVIEHTDGNVLAGRFFKEHFFQRKGMPIIKWVDIASQYDDTDDLDEE